MNTNRLSRAGASLAPNAFRDAIDAIGTGDFDRELLALLNRLCGAEHVALYRLAAGQMRSVGAASLDGSDLGRRRVGRYLGGQHWRRDPTMIEARRRADARQTRLVRIHPCEFPDGVLRRQIYRRIGERLLVYGVRGESLFGMSVLRGSAIGDFSDRQAAALGDGGDVLLSAVAKHAEMAFPLKPRGAALGSVAAIEAGLRVVFPALTARENQVCARLLFGVSGEGTALELGISEESVATYRKRAYRRLAISGRHELLRRFLGAA